jgi:hypothetical protein
VHVKCDPPKVKEKFKLKFLLMECDATKKKINGEEVMHQNFYEQYFIFK